MISNRRHALKSFDKTENSPGNFQTEFNRTRLKFYILCANIGSWYPLLKVSVSKKRILQGGG